MGSLLLNPHYCPEDKDIYDFLNSISVSTPELKKFLRKRGVYVSDSASKKGITELISRETFAWEDITDLIALATVRDGKSKYVIGNQKTDANFDVLESAITSAGSYLLNKYGDRLTVTKIDEDNISVVVDYCEINLDKTRLIQVIERESELLFTRVEDGFRTKRSTGSKSRAVELAVLGEFGKLATEEGQEVIEKTLKLSELTTTDSRVKFFAFLSENLQDFEFEEISSARVKSIISEDDGEFSEDDDGEIGEESPEIAAAIESLTFQGKNIGRAPIYNKYVGTDYYPISATWRVTNDDGRIGSAELRAGFIPVDDDFILEFSVLRTRDRAHGELETWCNPTKEQEKLLTDLLSECADRAFLALRTQPKMEKELAE